MHSAIRPSLVINCTYRQHAAKTFRTNPGAEKKIFLLKPRGFCAGVVRAIDVVKSRWIFTGAVYVRKEIVHNKQWSTNCGRRARSSSRNWTKCGGARAIFSAHGVAPPCARGQGRGWTDRRHCPLVTKCIWRRPASRAMASAWS